MTKFETINGQLCIMTEPVPLTKDAKFPCVVRMIQDDSRMGMYNKDMNCWDTIADMLWIAQNIKENPLFNKTLHAYEKDSHGQEFCITSIHQLEIIGYPVADGSAEWAVYQMMQGNKVTKGHIEHIYWHYDARPHLQCISEYNCGTLQIMVSPEIWIKTADKDGWRIYTEPIIKTYVCPVCSEEITAVQERGGHDGFDEGLCLDALDAMVGGHMRSLHEPKEETLAEIDAEIAKEAERIRRWKYADHSMAKPEPKQEPFANVKKGDMIMCSDGKKRMVHNVGSYKDSRDNKLWFNLCVENEGTRTFYFNGTLQQPENPLPFTLCYICKPKQDKPCFEGGAIAKLLTEPAPQYKVGDWVEHKESKEQGRITYIKSANYDAIEVKLYDADELETYTVSDFNAEFRKLSPSEVKVDFGSFKGTIEVNSHPFRKQITVKNTQGHAIAYINIVFLDTPTRELVQSLLKAQEEYNGQES